MKIYVAERMMSCTVLADNNINPAPAGTYVRFEDVIKLIAANGALLAAESPHMCHRNAKEREAYKAIRAALTNIGHTP